MLGGREEGMEMRSVMVNEADLIEKLFQQVYKKEQGINYWKWCFQNPFGYTNCGIFEDNRLVGYYSLIFTEVSACMCTAMVHPQYKNKGIYLKIANDLTDRASLNLNYVYLFSNKMIRPIHIEKEGFIEVYQIREYRIPILQALEIKAPFSIGEYSDYHVWRFRNHPLVKYIYHDLGVFSLYEDRIQIVDFKEKDLYEVIEYAKYLGYWEKKKYVSFWFEHELDLPYVLIPTWKHYKILNENLNIEDIMSIDRLRMGMSDVF